MPCSPCWRYGSIRSSMRCTSEPKFLILPNEKKILNHLCVHLPSESVWGGKKKIAQLRGNDIMEWFNRNRIFLVWGSIFLSSVQKKKKSKRHTCWNKWSLALKSERPVTWPVAPHIRKQETGRPWTTRSPPAETPGRPERSPRKSAGWPSVCLMG